MFFDRDTTHGLIHLTDKIRHEIDKGNDACWIFVHFQKVFDAVDHHILLKNLEYYGIGEISNKWFALYLVTGISLFQLMVTNQT